MLSTRGKFGQLHYKVEVWLLFLYCKLQQSFLRGRSTVANPNPKSLTPTLHPKYYITLITLLYTAGMVCFIISLSFK